MRKVSRYASGDRFGRLVLVERVGTNKHRMPIWRCLCDCGENKNFLLSSLTSGETRSCGCLRRELLAARFVEMNTNKETNPYVIDESGKVAHVTLTQGKIALIDVEDLPLVLQHHWCARCLRGNKWYAQANINNKTTGLHQSLLGTSGQGHETHCDHINGDGLDNRRQNLRVITRGQNNQNRLGANRNNYSTGIRGVVLVAKGKKYRIQVHYGYKNYYGGYFPATPDGLKEAEQAVVALRKKLMTHSDGR